MNPASVLARLPSGLKSRWIASLIWAIGVAIVIWFLAGLIVLGSYRPFETDGSRLTLIAIVFAVWLAANLAADWRKRRANRGMINDLTDSGGQRQGEQSAASAAEIAQLRTRLQEALSLLRKTGNGRRWGRDYLYQLPWYVMIGPPGSGKSTALLTSGLKFPLTSMLGRDPLKGIGGTRNCDWWFTEEAIVLDTAGRYTTQDSDPQADQAAWSGFLDLLKTHRPLQPINGVLIVLSLSEIAARDPAERLSHAQSVRLRLNELHDRFGRRFPVYVLFTKADLIAGFVEYFDALNKTEREQVWGVTLPLDPAELGEDGGIGQIPAELDLLVARLNDQLFERLQQEPDIDRRGLIYGFPNQIASLRDSVTEMLAEIFRPSRFDEQHPLLRGVYFASSTQVGTPIDRMMSVMSAGFGIDPQRLAPFPGQGRSYFLKELFHRVIFTEAAMVSADPQVLRRHRLVRIAAYAAAALLIAGLGTIWTSGYLANQRLISDIDQQLATYRTSVASLPSTDVSDTDLAAIVPPLDQLRDLPTGLKRERPNTWLTVGLYQGDKLQFQHDAVYRRALDGLLLPRLLTRLEAQLREHPTDSDYLVECLKVYLMLGKQAPAFDNDLVRHWLTFDWLSTYRGPANEKLRNDLAGHYDALVAGPLPDIALDAGLIAQIRQTLQAVPAANRAYALIKQSQAARDLAAWRVIDHAGPAADKVFTRNSGKPLTEGIAGFYTYRGFYQVFLPALDTVAKSVEAEAWVRADVTRDDVASNAFQHDVLALYLNDYATQWQSLLADLQMVHAQDLNQTIAQLNMLSSSDSPLALFVKSFAKETTLDHPPTTGNDGKPDEAAQKLLQMVAGGADSPSLTAQFDQKFRAIRDLATGVAGAPPPIDDLTRNLGTTYQQLSTMSQSLDRGKRFLSDLTDGSGSSSVRQLASRLPPPFDGWLGGMAGTVSTVSVEGAHSELETLWASQVRDFCLKATTKRYPLFRDSVIDMPLDDFAKLFAPGGLIDSFFNANLKQLVDTSRPAWRLQPGTSDLGISVAALAAFQHAAAIRDAFFPSNGNQPLIHFDLTPVDLDATATEVKVDIDGQPTSYRHGPIRPTPMQWPAPSGGQTRVTFTTATAQPSSTQTGPWALFRLLDASQMASGATAESFRITLTAGGQHAHYDIQTNSVNNPFNLQDLSQFRCPRSF